MTSAHIDTTSSTASFRRIDHRKVGHESNPYSDRSIHNGKNNGNDDNDDNDSSDNVDIIPWYITVFFNDGISIIGARSSSHDIDTTNSEKGEFV